MKARWLAVVLLAPLATPAAGSVPAAAALAAASVPTCHGRPATQVGAPHHVLTGTAGRDVVVTNGAPTVSVGAGDDLVCVTGSARDVSVDAGAGDDSVYVVTGDSNVSYRSGLGSDRYVGGGAGRYDDVQLRPDGHDDIRTLGGTDLLDVNAVADPGRPHVDLGSGADILYLHVAGTRGRYLGGSGDDTLEIIHGSQHHWTIDNSRQRALAGRQVRFRWAGFESFDLSFLRASRISFVGSSSADTLYLQDGGLGRPEDRRILDVATGAGDDQVTVSTQQEGRIDGGTGVDAVDFIVNQLSGLRSLAVDLGAGTAAIDYDTGSDSAWTLAGIEDVAGKDFPSTTLTGDDGPNVLDAEQACQAVVDGRGGDDVLTAATGCGSQPAPVPPTGAVVHGGEGNDSITGGPLDDTLDGDAGVDHADGREGLDTCRAETVTACELA